MLVSGYCTPDGGIDCTAHPLSFQITIGLTTYNSFILNGNGSITLGESPVDWGSLANSPASLAGFTMPIFSPQLDNAITSMTNGLDPSGPQFQETRWAASFSSAPGSLTAYWFNCTSSIFCGTDSLSAALYDGSLTEQEVIERQTWNMFGLTLTDLGSGFRLDYFYYPAFEIGSNFEYHQVIESGTYGFDLPSMSSLQETGPLVNRTFTFDGLGNLAVPEPATWLMMLLGFAAIGLTLRRRAAYRFAGGTMPSHLR